MVTTSFIEVPHLAHEGTVSSLRVVRSVAMRRALVCTPLQSNTRHVSWFAANGSLPPVGALTVLRPAPRQHQFLRCGVFHVLGKPAHIRCLLTLRCRSDERVRLREMDSFSTP